MGSWASPLAACGVAGAPERLSLFCLDQEVRRQPSAPLDLVANLSQRLIMIGQAPLIPGQFAVSSTDTYVAPLAYYSDNVNGGNPDAPLILSNILFTGDPALVRRSGAVLGARLGVATRRAHARGYVQATASVSRARSPEHGADIRGDELSACSATRLAGWQYLDACVARSRERKELTQSETRSARLTLSTPRRTQSGRYYETRVGLARVLTDDYGHNQLALGLSTIHGPDTFTDVNLTLGAPVRGELVTRQALGASLTQTVAGRPLSVSVSLTNAGGGLMIGVPRDERTRAVSLSYPIWRGVEAYVGYSERDSTIDYYDSSGVTGGLQLRAITF